MAGGPSRLRWNLCADVVEARRACGHAGPCCLAGGRLVGERDHAVRRGGRGDELQRELLPAAASRYRTNHHRVNGEPGLVDQVVLEQGFAESAVPVDHEVTAVLLLEVSYGGGEGRADDRGGFSGSRLHGRGEQVLAE